MKRLVGVGLVAAVLTVLAVPAYVFLIAPARDRAFLSQLEQELPEGAVEYSLHSTVPSSFDSWIGQRSDVAQWWMREITSSRLDFFGAVHLNRDQQDRVLRFLSRHPELTTLVSSGWDLEDDDLHRLSGLQELEGLSLSGTHITDAGLRSLRPMKSLYWVDLSDTAVTGPGLVELCALPQLHNVYLNGCRLDGRAFESLSGIRKPFWLHLDSVCSLSERDWAQFERLNTILKLDANDVRLSRQICTHIARAPNLQHISLGDTAMTDETLAPLASSKSLRRLTLARTRFTEGELRSLPKLERLQLTQCSLSEAALEHLPPVEELELMSCQPKLRDDDLRALARGHSAAALSKLRLTLAEVTLEGLLHLRACPKLELVVLEFCGVSSEKQAEIRRAELPFEIRMTGP